jgi:hypothetical protein
MILLVGQVMGHATLVLGTVDTNPNPPQAGEPFTLFLELADPTRIPVEDAVVVAEFAFGSLDRGAVGESNGQKSGERVTVRLKETSVAGAYQGELTLAQTGVYTLLLRDQTYRQEEARAELNFEVGSQTSIEPISFLFPPTETGARTLTTWLVWLIGLPVVAAVVVTVLVLTSHRSKEQQDAS